jgi:hypothetical protein
VRDASPTVMSDFSSTDEAFHEPGAQIAQAEPAEQKPGSRITVDFGRLRRMREEEEQAAVGTGGSNGAPATEPDPGSPEYQAADAVARRIADENMPEAGRAEATRPSVARDASVAVPAVPTLAPAGAVLGEIGQAAWEAAKKGAGLLVRVAPFAAGVGAAAPIILLPGNSGAELHPMGEGLRVRTAPGQRTATACR